MESQESEIGKLGAVTSQPSRVCLREESESVSSGAPPAPSSRSKSRLVALTHRMLPKGQLARGVLVIASGHAGGYALAAASLPILTRLYSPADFGVFGVYVSVLSMLGIVAGFRYEAAISIPEDDETAADLIVLSLSSACLLCGASMLTVWLLGDDWLSRMPLGGLQPYLHLLALNAVACVGFQVVLFWAVRKKAFSHLARMRIALAVAMVVTQVSAGLAHLGPTGLLLGQFMGNAAGVVYSLIASRKCLPPLRHVNAKGVCSVAVRFRQFPMFGAGAELANNACTALPPILLTATFGSKIAGLFLLGWRAVGAPLTLLVVPIARVYLSEASRIVHQTPEKLSPFFVRTIRRLTLTATGPVTVLAFTAPWLFPVVFGQEWNDAGIYCSLVCPLLLCQLFSVSVRPTFDVLNKQHLHLLVSVFGVGLTVLGVWLPAYAGMSASAAILSLSVMGCLGYLLAAGLAWMVLPGISNPLSSSSNGSS